MNQLDVLRYYFYIIERRKKEKKELDNLLEDKNTMGVEEYEWVKANDFFSKVGEME